MPLSSDDQAERTAAVLCPLSTPWMLPLFHGVLQEIQQLPYQHTCQTRLPSKLRSKDPGSDDCLDIQVETVNGRKDLRMRCQSVAAVNIIITDIRTTVQVVVLG